MPVIKHLEVEHLAWLRRSRGKQPATGREVLVLRSGGIMPHKLTIELPAEPPKEAIELARALLQAGPETVEAKLASVVSGLPEAQRSVALALARALAKAPDSATRELIEAAGVKLPKVPAPPVPPVVPQIPSEPILRGDGSLDLSGVPDDKRDVVRQAWEAKVEARKAREETDMIRAEQELERAVTRATTDLRHVPLEPEKLGGLLVRARRGMKVEDFKVLDELLLSVDRVVRESALLQSFGTSRSAGQLSGADKIEQMVRKRVEESGGKLSRAKAYELVLSSDEAAKAVAEDRAAAGRQA